MCFKHVNQLTVYFHIIHIPLQKAFTVFSKYSVFDHPNSYLANQFNLNNSLHTAIPISPEFSLDKLVLQYELPVWLAVCQFCLARGKKTSTTFAKSVLTNIEAARKKPLFLVVFVPGHTRLYRSFARSANKTAKFPFGFFKFLNPWSTSRPQKIDMIYDCRLFLQTPFYL